MGALEREPNAEPITGYRLIEPLGSGGFGEVWKCEAPGGLKKAIKFVYGNLKAVDDDSSRAEQELQALQRIREVHHPFILSLERIEVVDGELVIVMELADKSLHDHCVECLAAGLVGIPRDDLLRYLRDAAEALDHMNEKHSLQHLDVKPRNLFLISDRVKVADFGLVKHLERTSTSGLLGAVTPLYAPPETLTGKISERSDQYSLAVVYQELLTGTRPFNGKNLRALIQQHLQEEPDLRALPERERPVVARALSKDPAHRFPNCLAFLRGLYTAHSEARVGVVEAISGSRPRTLADTLEDFQLEQPDSQPEVEEQAPAGLDQASADVSQLGVTALQPQTGALRPTLVIGLGSFGRRALLELRCRFVDRFGELGKTPLVRFLYLDCDSTAVKAAVQDHSEFAFNPTEVYHLPLQPVGHYRRRQLEVLGDWLPREKLYALPRSLTPQGSRALGRLAFADSYLRIQTRLQRELQKCAHPDAIFQSVTQSGLALRDQVPRVYVIAAGGGSSSGFLVDLGYTLRRLLRQLRFPEASLTTFLLCGAPEDPATPPEELANVYATVTEVNHFADPYTRFRTQYGPDAAAVVESGPAFDAAYLLTQRNRSPEDRRDLVAHLSNYLFHELTTPLGLHLDQVRQLPRSDRETTPFRCFGTFGIWFPRGLLLRLAGREACKRLLEDWQGIGEPTATAEVEGACARVQADPDFRLEALAGRIEELAREALDGTPGEALTRLLATFEEQVSQPLATDDPGNWARQALARIREWSGGGLGRDPEASEWRKGRLGRALEGAAQLLALEWEKKLAEVALTLMEHSGRRLAASEKALNQFGQFVEAAATACAAQVAQQTPRALKARDLLDGALGHCLTGTGGFSFFGNRTRRLLRVFLDHLAAWARQSLVEDLEVAVQQFLEILRGKLEDCLRDVSFCRQRLRHLQITLDLPGGLADEKRESPLGLEPNSNSPMVSAESFWEAIRQSRTTRVILPGDEQDLERAAQGYLASLTPEQWGQLDQVLQDQVLGPLGGLHRGCISCSDLVRTLGVPLVEEAAQFLGTCLPVTDVAQVEIEVAGGRNDSLVKRAKMYFNQATPVPAEPKEANPRSYLLIPASDFGKRYGEEVAQAIPGLRIVRVPGQADLMFCREREAFSIEDLDQVLQPCRHAYDKVVSVPQASPHARFDILDWLPLAP